MIKPVTEFESIYWGKKPATLIEKKESLQLLDKWPVTYMYLNLKQTQKIMSNYQ